MCLTAGVGQQNQHKIDTHMDAIHTGFGSIVGRLWLQYSIRQLDFKITPELPRKIR